MSRYIIEKSFNHNVVLCIDTFNKKECILMGKGIGFSLKKGDKLKLEDNIEKKFFLMDEKNKKKLTILYNEIDDYIIGAVEEAIAKIHSYLKRDLSERIHITLLDHISFSINRHKNSMDIKNPFLPEIKILYKHEYNAALEVLKVINDKADIDLPEDEAGFIAMHIHAAISQEDVSKTSQNTEIIKEMIDYLESESGCRIDREGIDYSRIVTHLRFALDRIDKNINIENVLLDNIKDKLKKSYDISKKMCNRIYDDYGILFTDGEIGYIALHISRLLNYKG